MTVQSWLWIGFAGMAAGAAVMFLLGRDRRTRDEESHWLIHTIVPLLAMASYFAMAMGQGSLILADGREFHFARYVDWAFTTPLLLLGLCLSALDSPLRRWAIVLGLLAADAYMIATGAFAAASPAGSSAKWVWYLISCGAFAFLYLSLFTTLSREAAHTGPEAARVFAANRNVLALLWLIYPINFLIGPEGAGAIGPVASAAIYTALDLAAKVGFGLFAFRNTRARTTRELAAGLVPDHDLRPAPRAFHTVHAAGRNERDPR